MNSCPSATVSEEGRGDGYWKGDNISIPGGGSMRMDKVFKNGTWL